MLLVVVDSAVFAVDYYWKKPGYTAFFCLVVAALILLGVNMGVRMCKTGNRRYLILMIAAVAVLLVFVIFRMYVFWFFDELFHPIFEDFDKNCWTRPELDWK